MKKNTDKSKKKSGKGAPITYEILEAKISKGISAAIISSLAFVILGILFIVFPENFLDILRWIIAIIFLAGGMMLVFAGLRSRFFLGGTIFAAILIAVGLLFATQPGITAIFSVILGVWFIVSALVSFSASSTLSGSIAFVSGVMSFISLVCGILLIINPWGGSISMMMFLGVVTIIHAVSSLADAMIMRSHLKDIGKKIKPMVIEGEEVK